VDSRGDGVDSPGDGVDSPGDGIDSPSDEVDSPGDGVDFDGVHVNPKRKRSFKLEGTIIPSITKKTPRVTKKTPSLKKSDLLESLSNQYQSQLSYDTLKTDNQKCDDLGYYGSKNEYESNAKLIDSVEEIEKTTVKG
jgi:hypothetical protein